MGSGEPAEQLSWRKIPDGRAPESEPAARPRHCKRRSGCRSVPCAERSLEHANAARHTRENVNPSGLPETGRGIGERSLHSARSRPFFSAPPPPPPPSAPRHEPSSPEVTYDVTYGSGRHPSVHRRRIARDGPGGPLPLASAAWLWPPQLRHGPALWGTDARGVARSGGTSEGGALERRRAPGWCGARPWRWGWSGFQPPRGRQREPRKTVRQGEPRAGSCSERVTHGVARATDC